MIYKYVRFFISVKLRTNVGCCYGRVQKQESKIIINKSREFRMVYPTDYWREGRKLQEKLDSWAKILSKIIQYVQFRFSSSCSRLLVFQVDLSAKSRPWGSRLRVLK